MGQPWFKLRFQHTSLWPILQKEEEEEDSVSILLCYLVEEFFSYTILIKVSL